MSKRKLWVSIMAGVLAVIMVLSLVVSILPSSANAASISELEQQMVEREQLSERVRAECAEFEQYFPDVSLRRVPDEVWGQVRDGIPLSAAYALYEKKQMAKQEAYRLRNEQSAARSAGLPESAPQQYFSPAQVRAMSQREVRDNYDRIFESMRHWQ